MGNITLEKVDQVIERTAVTYGVAKEALEKSDGDVLEAIILIEEVQANELENCTIEEEHCKGSETTEDIKKWLINLVKKGNVSRVKIKKDGRVLTDIPVNAGIAAGAIAILLPPVLAVAFVATVATDLVIEVTKIDGSVEVVNKIVRNTADNIKEKTINAAAEITGIMKERTDSSSGAIIKESILKNIRKTNMNKERKVKVEDEITNFTYTVNFEDVE